MASAGQQPNRRLNYEERREQAEKQLELSRAQHAVSDWTYRQLQAGIAPSEIGRSLMERGLFESHDSATQYVLTLQQQVEKRIASHYEARKEESRTQAFNNILWGSVLAGGGGIVSLLTYFAASDNPTGGVYFVFYGAVIVGVIKLAIGLASLSDWASLKGRRTKNDR